MKLLLLYITPEQQLLKDTVREFAERELAPEASKFEGLEAANSSSIRSMVLSKLSSLGLFGITVPEKFGGAGADFSSLVIASEELSKASGSLGACFSLHNAVVCEAFRMSPNSNLRERVLPSLCSGTLGAFSLANDSRLSCTFDGPEIVVEGSADYVVSASSAGLFLFSARCGEDRDNNPAQRILFGFERELAESSSLFCISEPAKMLGMRSSGVSKVSFAKLRLPVETSLLVDPAAAGNFIKRLKARARFAMAAQAVGIAQGAIDSSIAYAGERKQFNTRIGNFYAVQESIANDVISIESARAFLYGAVSKIEEQNEDTLLKQSAIAKILASDCSVNAARHAVRIHGGYGFLRDYPVERYARDARFTQIYEEPNELLRSEIAVAEVGNK